VSIAEAWDVAVTHQPLVPPSPPRASETMGVFGRMAAMRRSAIETWGQRAYEEDIVQGRFFGHSSFILNTPDAIRHVLVDNYENYTRTPAGIRVLRPVLGEGLLIAEGRAWKHQRRTLAPAFTPRAVTPLVPHMIAATDETIAKLQKSCGGPVDLREAMQRMTLEIAGRTMFSFGMGRHGPALRDFVMEYGARLARPRNRWRTIPRAGTTTRRRFRPRSAWGDRIRRWCCSRLKSRHFRSHWKVRGRFPAIDMRRGSRWRGARFARHSCRTDNCIVR